MKRINNLLLLSALLLLTLVFALAVLNWPALRAEATWQLGFTEVQWPVGAVILLLSAALFAPWVVAYLSHVVGLMIETRRMVAEVHRLQKLADLAEASRIEGLRELISREFNRLQSRLDTLAIGGPGRGSGPSPGHADVGAGSAGPESVAVPTAKALGRWFRAVS